MQFDLTEEQLSLQALAREYVATYVKPVARQRDKVRDWQERAPWDLIEAGSKLGLRTVALPVEWGGMGIDYLTVCMLAEELAVGDCGLAIIFDHGWRWSRAMVRIANREQQQRFIPRFVEDHRCIVGHPQTEPPRGTDNMLHLAGHAAVQTTARRDGGHYVVNGQKIFISNASMAKFLMMLVRTGRPEEYPGGLSGLIVERATPGFSNGTIYHKLGSRLLINAEIILQDCRVPVENLLGQEGHALETFEKGYGMTHAEIGAVLLGTARAAYEDALAYAQSRVQGGTEIINHQAVQMRIADMYTDLEASRSLIWRAAGSIDEGKPDGRLLGIAARLFAGDASARVTQEAMKLFGGSGIMEDLSLEKYVRDSLAFQHMHGTNDVLRIKATQTIQRLQA